jgi:hypothetical protein
MHIRVISVFVLLSMLLTACAGASALPPGVVEFKNPYGTFRVTAPEGWKTSPELMRSTAAQSASGDMMFNVLTVNPQQTEIDAYSNHREYTKDGRTIIVADGIGSGSGTFNGITMSSGDMLHAFVTVGEKSYNVVLQRANTVTKDPSHDQLLVDMAASFEQVQ